MGMTPRSLTLVYKAQTSGIEHPTDLRCVWVCGWVLALKESMLLKEKFNDVQLPWRQKARQAMHGPKGEAPVSFGRQTGAKGKHDPWSFSEEKTVRGRGSDEPDSITGDSIIWLWRRGCP